MGRYFLVSDESDLPLFCIEMKVEKDHFNISKDSVERLKSAYLDEINMSNEIDESKIEKITLDTINPEQEVDTLCIDNMGEQVDVVVLFSESEGSRLDTIYIKEIGFIPLKETSNEQ